MRAPQTAKKADGSRSGKRSLARQRARRNLPLSDRQVRLFQTAKSKQDELIISIARKRQRELACLEAAAACHEPSGASDEVIERMMPHRDDEVARLLT